jgi:Icc-related predicted phosphoesterase
LASVRIAAVGDVHCDEQTRGKLGASLRGVNEQADALVLAGDLTAVGKASEARCLVEELREVRVPVVAVLGNHDYEFDQEAVIVELLQDAGIHVLDGSGIVLELAGQRVGFAGAKGFCGGFGRYLVAPFGEQSLKAFVKVGLRESLGLADALRRLGTERRVVVLHYAPIRETLAGESPELFPFLGNGGLCQPIDEHGADVVFHGHAHNGFLRGQTPRGIPVYNVAQKIVETFVVHELPEAAVGAESVAA